MNEQMSEEEMLALQEQAGANQGGDGDVTALAKQVGQGLSQLAEKLSSSAEANPEAVDQMSQILNMYIDLIENKLGGGEPQAEPMPSQIPAQAGLKGVPLSQDKRQ